MTIEKLIYDRVDKTIIERAMLKKHPELAEVTKGVDKNIPDNKRRIETYQAHILYHLVKQLSDRKSVNILEVGTAYGYSAAYMAEALRNAKITTLNPKPGESDSAIRNLAAYPSITVVQSESAWFYVNTPALYDFIFIDGDHDRVENDFPYWLYLKRGGVIIHHDYSPKGTPRACPHTFDALNVWRRMTGEPHVLITTLEGDGMIGWKKGALAYPFNDDGNIKAGTEQFERIGELTAFVPGGIQISGFGDIQNALAAGNTLPEDKPRHDGFSLVFGNIQTIRDTWDRLSIGGVAMLDNASASDIVAFNQFASQVANRKYFKVFMTHGLAWVIK